MMNDLSHNSITNVTNIWQYQVHVWKGMNDNITMPEHEGTRYILSLDASIHTDTINMGGLQCNALQTNCKNPWAKLHKQKSTVVDIRFSGLNLNEESMYVTDGLTTGNLSYMDGGTNSNAISPPRAGLPVVNYTHFPAKMSQTLHTHPSQRIGLVLNGHGEIELDNHKHFRLEKGSVFFMERNTLHNFITHDEDVTLFVFAPDSGTGPTDEVNPLKVRTYVGQQR